MKLGLKNLHKLALSSAACGVVFCASAQAEGDWYVGLGAGISLANDVAVPGSLAVGNTVLRGATAKRDASFRGIASLGYRWQQFRLEGEVGFSDPSITALSVGGVSTPLNNADLAEVTVFGNVLYDLPIAQDLALTLGGGLGLGSATLDTGTAKMDDNGFAFQTIAGLSYRWSENLDLGLDYRYVRTSGLSFGGGSSDIGSHNLLLSLRWHFDRTEAPVKTSAAAMRPVATLPPPPASPPVKTYIVFFDFNKSYLTDAAQSVVVEAVKVARATGMVKVLIAGHTDMVGSDDNNTKLSLARAATIKDEMVRLGVDGRAIAVEGKGYQELLVAAAATMREPQTRRAVADLGS